MAGDCFCAVRCLGCGDVTAAAAFDDDDGAILGTQHEATRPAGCAVLNCPLYWVVEDVRRLLMLECHGVDQIEPVSERDQVNRAPRST